MRRDARENLNDPDFLPVYGENVQEARERVTRAAEAGDSGRVSLGFPKEYGGEDDAGGSATSIEMLAFGDLSLMVKAGVQWGLFGGALQMLGNSGQHEKYLRDVMSFDLPGCFAMTETGTAPTSSSCGRLHLRPRDRDLRPAHPAPGRAQGLHRQRGQGRPDGGRLRAAHHLGKNHGVHAWLVPIRSEDGTPCPASPSGTTARRPAQRRRQRPADLRPRHGPRDMLLDRYGQVAADGTYTSSIENETRRFFTMLGTSCAAGSASAARLRRRPSWPSTSPSATATSAASSPPRATTARSSSTTTWCTSASCCRALATTYALHFAQGQLVETMHDVQAAETIDEEAQRELESRAAGLKVAQTWHATRTIQLCREACGGAGYLQENRLPHLKADTDVFTTFEGDNTVLLQLVAKGLLTGYRDAFGSLEGWGKVGFIADMVRETVLERTAARALIARLSTPSPAGTTTRSRCSPAAGS